MRLICRFVSGPLGILFLASIATGCSGGAPPSGGGAGGQGGTGEDPGDQGIGGSRTGGRGGAAGAGGRGGSTPTSPDAASNTTPDANANSGTSPDASAAATPDASTGGVRDAGAAFVDSNTPMGSDGGGPQPSYAGEIPIYYGPEVGPVVKMDCPGDPTEGWTEYQESFNVQRPYDVPINTRFSIIGGIYKFWVFPDDAPHSPTAMGRNPRSEARYGGTHDAATGKNFRTGQRLYSADMFIERNAVNSAIMQIHTTAPGGGPIGVRIHSNSDMVNNGSLTVVQGSSVPGGLIDRWFNYKAAFNADTLEVKIYINNCLKSTYKGPRGDGNFYFKNGVYFCKTSQNGCFAHFKNIHLYKK
jgi:hypothetical protein